MSRFIRRKFGTEKRSLKRNNQDMKALINTTDRAARGFGKTALAEAIQKRGIDYLHLPGLDSPRDIRHAYRQDGDWGRYTERFLAYLAKQSAAVERVAALVRYQKCCLFCYEDDYHFCHRSFVAERAARAITRSA
jgi:uncharacterized protein (DUF488 family)